MADYHPERFSATGAALLRGAGVAVQPPNQAPSPAAPWYVVHTVHGTWGRRSEWPAPASALSRAIVRELPGPARIEPFGWSGRNQVGARDRAVRELRGHLRRKFHEFPDAEHFIVAHSHGGNVALMAAADADIADRLSGVATLSTPFLSAEVRDLRALGGTIAFIAALCTGFGYAAWRLFDGSTWAEIGWRTTLAIAGAWTSIAAGSWLLRAMHRRAVRIDATMPRTRLPADKVAILRVQGDEPIAVIAGLRLAGTVADIVYGKIDRPLFAASSWLLERWNYDALRAASERALDWIADEPRVVPGYATVTSMPHPMIDLARTHWPLGFAFAVQTFADAHPIVHDGALAAALLYALPAAFAVLVEAIRIPFALICGVSLTSIGLAAPLAGPYLNLVAEASPPGRWTVTNLSGGGIYGGLLHSKIYAQRELVAVITGWIAGRVTRQRAPTGR